MNRSICQLAKAFVTTCPLRLRIRWTWCLLLACFGYLTAASSFAVAQVDTDGDGRLDVLDTPGFDAVPNELGRASFYQLGIQDLDGLNQLISASAVSLSTNSIASVERGDFDGLTNLETLSLEVNQIATVERGDFDGLSNLQTLWLTHNRVSRIQSGAFDGLNNLQVLALYDNQLDIIERGVFNALTNLRALHLGGNPIASIESGAFRGLADLQTLGLENFDVSELNLTGASFTALVQCEFGFIVNSGLCVDSDEITRLTLDDATLNVGSFEVIASETTSITDASFVGLTFTDATSPDRFKALLEMESLDNVWVDHSLLDLYADELNAFGSKTGNTLGVVPLGDCSKDGLLTSEDMNCIYTTRSRDALLTALDTLPGDLDGDGEVVFDDFLKLSNNFGTHLPSYADGNINLEGGIDFADFLILSENFGMGGELTNGALAAVPEPSGNLLPLVVLLVGARRFHG